MAIKPYLSSKTFLLLFWLIYFVTLLIRLQGLKDLTVYPDEITWMVKGKEAFYALKNLNLDYFKYGWWNDTKDAYAIGWVLTLLSGVFHVFLAGTSKFSLNLLSDITASRLPGIIISSFLPSLIFSFSYRFFNLRIAIFSSLAFSFSPIVIGVDRWVIHDSFLGLFMFLSMSTFITAIKSKQLSFFPGLYLGLAALTKPLGILPLLTWFYLYLINRKDRSIRNLFFANVVMSFAVVQIIWPQSWLEPLIAYPKYLLRQITLANSGDPIPNFYLGKATSNPHWSYYLYTFFSRTPEILIALIIISTYFFFYKIKFFSKNSKNFLLSIFITLSVAFCFLSISAVKGGARYLIFILPWIYIVAAWGLDQILIRMQKIKTTLFISCLLPLCLIGILFHPDEYLYYNLLVGGGEGAKSFDLVALCYGNKAALNYIDEKNIPGSVFILGCDDAGLYHTNRKITKNFNQANIIVAESSFIQQHPKNQYLSQAINFPLIARVNQKGITTAFIYKRPTFLSPQ